MNITVVILTFNEERHLARCIASVSTLSREIVVVDSFSTDGTIAIAEQAGARVIQHEWVNPARQFNWALTQLDTQTEWVLRIDADEYLTPALVAEIKARVPRIPAEVCGVSWGRRMTFQGRLIRHGGVFPVKVLRMFRHGHGQSEDRWMDEHIKVAGSTVHIREEMIDDNLNSLSWWTQKHNVYASREAVDLLNLEYRFAHVDSIASFSSGSTARKRWFKEHVYRRMPAGLRACLYFVYRYLIRLGFLDGHSGTAFHFLQGFWYRYLVDTKVLEVKRHMRERNTDVKSAISDVLGVTI